MVTAGRDEIVSALVAATIFTLLAVGGLAGTVVIIGTQGQPGHVDLWIGLLLFVAGSAVVWPGVCVLSFLAYVFPKMARGAAVWPTVLLALLTLYIAASDLAEAETISWRLLGLVWLFSWPLLFTLSMARRIGWKLGREAILRLRERLESTSRALTGDREPPNEGLELERPR